MSTRPSTARPSRRKRDSVPECCTSGPSRPFASRNTVTASSNETPCLAVLASAFRGSHSTTIQYIQNQAGTPRASDISGRASPAARREPARIPASQPRNLALCLVAYGAFLVLSGAWWLWKDPAQLRERDRVAANVKTWDKVIVRVSWPCRVLTVVIAGLDAGRFRWSSVPLPVEALG